TLLRVTIMQDPVVCSICKEDQTIITDVVTGEIVCGKCGLVISDKIQDTRQEWRDFLNTEEAKDRRRTGIPTSLAIHDMGLYTMIGRGHKDARGQVLDVSMRSTMRRLRTWDLRTQASANRNLGTAFNQLNILKDKLGLPDAIIEKTAYIYRKARERGLGRGRETSAALAAALYLACREEGTPRTLKEICLIISRQYRDMVIELDIRIPTVDPIKCIARIANEINLSQKITQKAIKIMNAAIKSALSAGKSPMGLAASILYLSCLINGCNNISQTVFAQTAGVTEVTIRNVSKDLRNHLDLS
ncbi:MAG: TFIIB-type zinc ribbon-containing protein, partial [Nitrososphaeraceae archaeon]